LLSKQICLKNSFLGESGESRANWKVSRAKAQQTSARLNYFKHIKGSSSVWSDSNPVLA
jgi:hypothetical protein